MRAFLFSLPLTLLVCFLQAQDPGMQAAQAAQIATQNTQMAMQAAQQANAQMMRDAQTANQNAMNASQQASLNSYYYRRGPAAPHFSIGSGTYSSPLKVTITAEPKAKIYYTTDDWTPTEHSLQYSAPITIDSTTILQAIAVFPDGSRSRTAWEVYTLKGVSPAVSALPAPIQGGLSNAAAAAAASGKLFLARGTPVSLVFAKAVNSKTAHPGDKIYLTLAADLTADGVVVAKQGALSTATITEVEKRHFLGRPGEVFFKADSLQADGVVIQLQGMAAKEGLDGENAQIAAGAKFTAYVSADTVLPKN